MREQAAFLEDVTNSAPMTGDEYVSLGIDERDIADADTPIFGAE